MVRRSIILAIVADVIFTGFCTERSSYHRRPKPICGANKTYSSCPEFECRPLFCSEVGYPVRCYDVSPDEKCPGKPGCICEEGFVRNSEGHCVLMVECPSCGGDCNAVSGCGVNCGKRCSNYDKGPVACTDICYYNACDCKVGYVFDDNLNKCVEPEKCTPTCPVNEIFDSCLAKCPAQRCDVNPALILCQPNPEPGDPECESGCRCIDNYVRDTNGTCIPREECPKRPPNEIYDECPAPCPPKRCDVDERTIRCAKPPEIGDPRCEPGCRCQDGYKRNSDGDCIPSDDCPPFCGPDEVPSDCVNGGCGPKQCSDLGFPTKCVRPKICKKGCLCKEDYVRNDYGICIPKLQCPSCGGDSNAEVGCGINCGRLCSNYNRTGPVKCPRICKPDACDCKKGYVYDENIKKCVLPTQCSPVCGANEVYDDCKNGYCSAQNCSEIGKPIACPSVTKCLGGCVCENGYLRAENGTCIPEKQCPSICSGTHEYYDSCPPNCPPQTCESLNRTYACPIEPVKPYGADECLGECRCEPGYYRNLIGECISEEDCLKCTGPHEYFSCGVFCDNVCETLKEQNQTNCPIATFVCVKQCYCEKDYARAANGTCIPIDNCEAPYCSQDEVYTSCIQGQCGPKTCKDLGKSLPCPRIDPTNCKEGCLCKEGYLRSDNGDCIPEEQCPKTCGKNEIYSNCTNQLCTPSTCAQLGLPISCAASIYCNAGCMCDNGYLRADNGTCILKKDCPTCGGDENAEAGCGVNCGRHCSDYNKHNVICPDICNLNGCDCKKNYVYDSVAKKCVLPKDCPSSNTNETTVSNGKRGKQIDAASALADIQRGNLKLTGALLKMLYDLDSTSGFVFSAISLLIAFAQLALYAVGATKEELFAVLNVLNDDQIRAAFPELIKSYSEQQNVTLELAVKCYGNINYHFTENFSNDSVDIFNSEAESINFAKNQEAANNINSWVAKKTHDMIKSIVTPEMLSADTVLIILNAIYFLGSWQKQFPKENTRKQEFYTTPDKTTSIDFMHQQSRFYYKDNDEINAQTLRMFYKGGNMSLNILLPHEKDGLFDVITKLSDPDVFARCFESMSQELVAVTIPKWETETTINVKQIADKLNITQLVNPESDNLKGIIEENRPIFASDILQKTKIKVDEVGTEAATATGIIVGTLAATSPQPRIIPFYANHPFIYTVLLDDSPLFNGIYTGQS